ncbi:hypothetical protein RUM44_000143 [Polyplax serrata]|uniref:G-protein coupled receptors family 3 profile domain-containing protein n=1 Tax=Polyplax serrata TaxID=468196 RepID=A0ABR1B4L1_POLSC
MLKQFQGGQEVKIGEFNGVTESLDLSRGHVIRWLGKYPPKDRTLQIFEHNQVNLTVYILLASTASLGIIMTIVFLTINIMFRNQRYIKMSSPYLNNLIIIGCMLTYSSVIFLGLDSQLTSVEAFPYVCTARAWLLMSGFSLAFGSMFSKTWRVHSIFTDVKLNKKVIKDYQLFIVVGVLVGIDLAIMTTWQVADPFYRETKQMDPYPDPTNDDILIIPENEYCQSEKMTIFVGSIYAYKGLLMIFGAFLAWETRHVSIPALNDSKYVGMSVYNVVIMCVMGAAISFVLSDKQDASFIIISVFIIFCTTATLCLVFVPKLVELRRNPQGVIDKKTRATLRPITKTRRDSIASELEDKIKDAKLQHSKYRKQLLDTESELQILVRRLGSDASKIGDPDSGTLDRLTVPLLKKEGTGTSGVIPNPLVMFQCTFFHLADMTISVPSGTETTEISSLCSLNSSQDDDYFNDPNKSETPGQRKKTSFARKSVELDKQESILRKEQKTRFCDEPDKVPPGKNVSFGPSDQKGVQKARQQQQQQVQLQAVPQQQQVQLQTVPQQQLPPVKQKPQQQEVKTKSEQNLEKLGITQLHPKPRQEFDCRQEQGYPKGREYATITQQPSSGAPTYLEDLQEKKIQEVTSHLTSQLLKKHDLQYVGENVRRRSSVKSANLNDGNLTCQLKQRRTSVPNWSSNRVNVTEKKNNTKNVEKKKMLVDERTLWQERRPSYKKHGGYIEFTGSDADVNWSSDYEGGFGSEKDVYSNGSYQNYGYQESHEGLGTQAVVKYIEKDEYWVTQPDISSRRGSVTQKGRISPYLLKDNVNNLSSSSVADAAQAQDVSCIHRSGSERGYRASCHGGSTHEPPTAVVQSHQSPRIRPQPVMPSSSRKVCPEHFVKSKSPFGSNLTHVLSTPDVAAIPPYNDSKTFNIYATEKRVKGSKGKSGVMGGSGHLCTAVSEGELLDLSILPIFQKLLTERHKSRTGYGASIASCPNISIKCDIVEYL